MSPAGVNAYKQEPSQPATGPEPRTLLQRETWRGTQQAVGQLGLKPLAPGPPRHCPSHRRRDSSATDGVRRNGIRTLGQTREVPVYARSRSYSKVSDPPSSFAAVAVVSTFCSNQACYCYFYPSTQCIKMSTVTPAEGRRVVYRPLSTQVGGTAMESRSREA